MKARRLPPGRGDALALSFARPVANKSPLEYMSMAGNRPKDYDLYS